MKVLPLDELKRLTRRASRKLVCKELDNMGIHYELGIDGWPRVLEAHAEDVLSGRSGARRKTRPDFSGAST